MFTADAKESDFETAIESTGYGKFNYMLLLIALPCCCSSVFETTSMSLILPSAECELKLTLFHKGVLNAVTYGGKKKFDSNPIISSSKLPFRHDKLRDFVGIHFRYVIKF